MEKYKTEFPEIEEPPLWQQWEEQEDEKAEDLRPKAFTCLWIGFLMGILLGSGVMFAICECM